MFKIVNHKWTNVQNNERGDYVDYFNERELVTPGIRGRSATHSKGR